MPCNDQGDTARTYDPHVADTPERSPGRTEAPRPRLTAVHFGGLVGTVLAILVVLLAAVMLNAGVNVEALL